MGTPNGGQNNVVNDTVKNFNLHLTTKKAKHSHYKILSFSLNFSKDHYVVVVDLISMQDALKTYQCRELFVQPLKWLLISSQQKVSHFFELGERLSSLETDKFGVVGNFL